MEMLFLLHAVWPSRKWLSLPSSSLWHGLDLYIKVMVLHAVPVLFVLSQSFYPSVCKNDALLEDFEAAERKEMILHSEIPISKDWFDGYCIR